MQRETAPTATPHRPAPQPAPPPRLAVPTPPPLPLPQPPRPAAPQPAPPLSPASPPRPPLPRPLRFLYLGGRGQGSRMGRARFVALRFPKNTEMYQKIADPRSAATRERTRPAVLQSPRSAMPTPKGEKPDSSIHFVTFWESIPSISRTNPAAASEKRHAFHLRSAKPRHSTQRNKAAPPHEKTDRRQDAPLRSKPLDRACSDRACSDRACACARNRLRPADHPAVESLGRPLSSLAASPINHD